MPGREDLLALLAGTRVIGRPRGAVMRGHLEWMRLRGLAPSTIRRRAVVMGWVEDFLAGTPLLEATPGQLLAWRATLDVAPEAVCVYVSHVRQFYRWAVAEGLLGGSPAASLPVARRGRLLPRPIGEQDLLAAVAAAPARIRPWLVLAGWAGLRACEIAGLRRENVLDTRYPPLLLVGQHATKGGRERLVPLSVFVLAELAPHLPAHGWVFPRLDGRPGPNTPARVCQLANTHLHDCGVAATLHQLRHRFGSQAYACGGDLRVVQELLGHASPRTTAGYTAYSPSRAVAAVAAIPAPLMVAGGQGDPGGAAASEGTDDQARPG